MGSFFKGYGSKWKKRKPRPHSELALKDKQQLANPRGGMKVQVYAAPLHDEDGVEAAHDFMHLQCEVEFDPEKDYAQVLAEARTHLKLANPNPTPWLPATTTSQNHLDAYRELHSTLGKPTTTTKHSKIWRYFLFWQKPSHNHQVEAEFESIFSTPPRPTCKQLRGDTCIAKTRADGGNNVCNNKSRRGNARPPELRPITKSNSGPLNNGYGSKPTRQNNSGPLYTDGLPIRPYNVKPTKKSYSGPLGPVYSNYYSDHLSSYELLHRPPISSPLYCC